MESLTGSTLSLSLVKHKHTYRGCISCCPRDVLGMLNRPEFQLLRCSNQVDAVTFRLSVFSQPGFTHPRLTARALSSPGIQTQLQDGDLQFPDADESKTVRVKFQLQRECSFGQLFFIVGDDPTLGSWDPSRAIPLNWSDGHIWNVELEIPIGKSVRYKFILKEGDEATIWQPGEDRMLQTWETGKTITVTDDWDNSEQRLSEEEPNTDLSEKITVNSESQVVAENLTRLSERCRDDTNKEQSSDTSYTAPFEKLSSHDIMDADAANDATERKEDLEVPVGKIESDFANQSKVSLVNYSEGTVENMPDSENAASCTNFPVLVPGLTPPTTPPCEELSGDEEDSEAEASQRSGKVEELNVPELKEEAEDASGTPEKDIVEGDLEWGRRTLQKFLTSFGLLFE